ncbi:hypothetical protein PLICRDRAFT_52024 [Plicaturopsis crispa FD-325 SS-3]|nr:hypothetical protein PLICRDRAFT_52024 [Plicaturopsis crispa FD-325 SS-3]
MGSTDPPPVLATAGAPALSPKSATTGPCRLGSSDGRILKSGSSTPGSVTLDAPRTYTAANTSPVFPFSLAYTHHRRSAHHPLPARSAAPTHRLALVLVGTLTAVLGTNEETKSAALSPAITVSLATAGGIVDPTYPSTCTAAGSVGATRLSHSVDESTRPSTVLYGPSSQHTATACTAR